MNEKVQITDKQSDRSDYSPIDYPVRVSYIDLLKSQFSTSGWEWHDEIEIDIVNSGNALFSIGDSTFTLSAGQAVVISKGALHSILPANNGKCTLYSITFHPSIIFGYGQCYLSVKYLTPVLNKKIPQYYILNEEIPWQETLMDQCNSIIAVNTAKKYSYELLTKSYLCQFWAGLLEKLVPDPGTTESNNSIYADELRVKNAIVFIESHFSEQITLDDIASSIHLSKSECCRSFKRTLNLTPFEYLIKYRIYTASLRIMEEDPISDSIAFLATSVGFNNTSYFNKVFKKYLGFTPGDYKKLVKKGPSNYNFSVSEAPDSF